MTKPASQARLSEIEARLAAATPIAPFDGSGLNSIHFGGPSAFKRAVDNHVAKTENRMAVLEQLPDDIKFLLDQMAALTASRESLRTALTGCLEYWNRDQGEDSMLDALETVVQISGAALTSDEAALLEVGK